MGLAGRISEPIEVPGEPGEWIKVKDLTYSELREVVTAAQTRRFAFLREQGDVLAIIDKARAERPDVIAEATSEADAVEVDPLAGYDLDTLLRLGLAGWSYTAELDPTQLTLETARFAAIEVLRYSGQLPETKAERKNGSSPSTAS